jgi:light-regulated signal transduction histidine kinase (bacteriophytochrome)
MTNDDELNRVRAAFREFMSMAVHDLREPLRAIGANTDLLAASGDNGTTERAVQCLSHIQQGVDQMDSLLRDIAEYCHGEGRQLKLAEIQMGAVLDEAQRLVSEVLRSNEAILTHDPLPAVTGDFFALAAVFRSLLLNACKFRSTEAPRIHVRSIRSGSEWHFSVRDNGLGFKSAYSETIFQPFKRLNGKKYPGGGLGLSLTKTIVEQHGGRIWADSTPGDGSTFWFTLPASEST